MKHFILRVAALLAFATISLTLMASIADLPVKTINGKRYYYYTVQPQETVYSLCKRFEISRDAMLESNPSVADGLKAGQTLIFPVEMAAGATPATTTYMVQKDETGYGISRKFNMTVEEFYQLNPEAKDGLKAGQYVLVVTSRGNEPIAPKPSSDMSSVAPGKHVIAPGETLYHIAQTNNITLRDLLAANPSLNPESYTAGQEIIIPDMTAVDGPVTAVTAPARNNTNKYEVKEGDTFYGIAQAHGLTVDQLVAANPSIDILKAGMEIDLPQGCEPAVTDNNTVSIPGMATVLPTDTMSIAIILPFKNGNNRSVQAIEFLRGFVLAVDSLRSSGSPIRLLVINTTGTEKDLRRVFLTPGLKESKIVVASNSPDQQKVLGRFAIKYKINLLNLFSTKDETYLTNPFVMNGNISHDEMYAKAINYYITCYPDVTPVFIKRKNGNADKAEFVTLFKEKLKSNGTKYHEIEYTDKLSDATLNQLPSGKYYAFIPNTSDVTELQKFIDAVVAYRDAHPEQTGASLWGYPEWIKYRGDLQKKFHNANTLIFSRFYAVEKNPDEELLQEKFSKWYGKRIDDKAPKSGTLGFDTGMYLIKALSANGGDFSKFTPSYDGLQNAFNFVRVPDGGWINTEMFMINYAPGEYISKFGL